MNKALRNPSETRERLIQAVTRLILQQGFAATSVEAICREAGVTKGSFFHHFKTKEAIGLAAVDAWSDMGTALYSEAWRESSAPALKQLHAMFDIMEGFSQCPDAPCVCVVGMMSQELALANPEVAQHCRKALALWTANVSRLLDAAKQQHPVSPQFDSDAIAWFLNGIWQGSMLIAKTQANPGILTANLRHARAYLDSLFAPEPSLNPN